LWKEQLTGQVKKSIEKVIFIMILCLVTGCEQENPPGSYASIEGIFSCRESSAHTGSRQYLVEIDKVHDEDDLYIISNFHNRGENEFIYTEYTSDTIHIFNQVLENMTINGKGIISGDYRTIDLAYITDDGITVLDYFATLTR
jgi:hypothetical protein